MDRIEKVNEFCIVASSGELADFQEVVHELENREYVIFCYLFFYHLFFYLNSSIKNVLIKIEQFLLEYKVFALEMNIKFLRNQYIAIVQE